MFKQVILSTENRHGRIYPMSVLESIVEEFHNGAIELFGQIEFPENRKVLLSEASHVIKNLFIEGNKLIAEIEVLDNSKGKLLDKMIKNSHINFRPFGIATLAKNEEGVDVVKDFKMITICALYPDLPLDRA